MRRKFKTGEVELGRQFTNEAQDPTTCNLKG